MNKKGWKGSFTVEAAFVISISFLVLGALTLAILFLHDKAVIQALVCETSAAGSNFAAAEERSEASEDVRREINTTRLLGSRNVTAAKGVGKKTVSVSASAEYPVPGMLLQFLKQGKLTIACSWNCPVWNPGKSIRKIRGAERLIDIIE